MVLAAWGDYGSTLTSRKRAGGGAGLWGAVSGRGVREATGGSGRVGVRFGQGSALMEGGGGQPRRQEAVKESIRPVKQLDRGTGTDFRVQRSKPRG